MAILIIANGKEEQLRQSMPVSDFLKSKNLKPELITIELNGEVLRREKYHLTKLCEGDKIELLSYMGGG